MDINSLLRGKKCTCARNHECTIKHVLVEKGAIEKLSKLLNSYKTVLLVADENTYFAAGERVSIALKEKRVIKHVFLSKPLLIPDETAICALAEKTGGIDVIVGIGSGVIQDLCKYVSFEKKIPYYIVATAPSMDGYASTGAAMITDGMKVTYLCGLPEGIIADVDVLKNAPMDMIKAGYGDIVGKYSALSDWRLASVVNGEYFCDYVYELTYSMIKKTVPLAEKLLERDEESIKILAEALVAVGIAMSFAGNSRPASGSEHHLSHFFEITGIVNGEGYLPHGIDVLYSTVVTASLRERLLMLSDFSKQGKTESVDERNASLRRVYSSVADGCIALQEKLGTYKKNRLDAYAAHEGEIRKILGECPSADEIKKLVLKIGLNEGDFYKVYGKEKIIDAVKYAKDLKDRYTVLWMYYDVLGEEIFL